MVSLEITNRCLNKLTEIMQLCKLRLKDKLHYLSFLMDIRNHYNLLKWRPYWFGGGHIDSMKQKESFGVMCTICGLGRYADISRLSVRSRLIWSDLWNISNIELRILKSSKLWSSQLWPQFKQLHIEAWKSQDFRTSRYRCDALNNWAMKPLTLGASHLWVLMSPWGCEVIYEMFYILNCGFEIK